MSQPTLTPEQKHYARNILKTKMSELSKAINTLHPENDQVVIAQLNLALEGLDNADTILHQFVNASKEA